MHIDLVNTTLNAKIFSNAHTPFMPLQMHTTNMHKIKMHNHAITFIAMHLTSWPTYMKSTAATHLYVARWTPHTNTPPHIARLLTIEIINNYYKHAKIKSPFQNFIDSEPVDGRTMPERRPADDHRIYWCPMETGRCPASHRWAACRLSSGHRPKILSSAERIGWSPNSRPVVAGRRLLPDFYNMVQGRKNPAMICRCQKAGIGEKPGGHRRIYKACDVPLRLSVLLHMFHNTHDWSPRS